MTLPKFLVAGAAKCGTTSLHAWLRAHPGIFMPEFKEPHYFTVNHRLGLAWYEAFFDGAGTRLPGEASPGYFSHPEAVDRIAALIPDVRLVFVLREPTARLISHYWFMMQGGRIPFGMPFDRFLEAHPRIAEIGLYEKHLKTFAARFARERMHVALFEDLVGADGDETLRGILEFLEVDDTVRLPRDEVRNPTDMPSPDAVAGRMLGLWRAARSRIRKTPLVGPLDRVAGVAKRAVGRRPMTREERERAIPPEQRARIAAMYEEPTRRLEEWLGRDLSAWRKAAGRK